MGLKPLPMADTCDDCGYYWKAHPPSGDCPGPRLKDQSKAPAQRAKPEPEPEPATLFEYLIQDDDSAV